MTPEHHDRIQQLFDQALELPAAERPAFLDRAGDDLVRARVERMLQTVEDTGAAAASPVQARRGSDSGSLSGSDGVPERLFDSPIDGKYRVEQRLGRGGMGAVYLVTHTGLNRRFALKLILPESVRSERFRAQFEDEARALGRLKHPNIVDVTDFGVDPRDGGLPYLVMEFLEGRTLRDWLRDRGPMPIEEALPLLRQIAEAVDFAHASGIVHGDLKPLNLFRIDTPAGPQIKVLDFGLATMISDEPKPVGSAASNGNPDATGSGSVPGTPAYMAAELLDGTSSLTRMTDIYALGAVAYEMLSGHPPFGQSYFEVLFKTSKPLQPASERNAALSPLIDAPLAALLAGDPTMRPATALAGIEAIGDAWLTVQQRAWRKMETRPRALYAAITTLAALLVAAGLAQLGPFQILEHRIADLHLSWRPAHPPTAPVVLLALDEAALSRNPKPLAEWDGEFANMIGRLFASGARAVALDLVLPSAWSRSERFNQAILRWHDNLVLGLLSAANNDVLGAECISPLTARLLTPEKYTGLFGYVDLVMDADGAMRHAMTAFPDVNGQLHPAFIARALTTAGIPHLEPRGIFRVDPAFRVRALPQVAWNAILDDPGAAAAVKDQLVIVGATYAGSGDEHALAPSMGSAPVNGALLHAWIAQTLAGGTPLRETPAALWAAVLTLPCLAVAGLFLLMPGVRPGLLVCAACALLYAASAVLAVRWGALLPLLAPELALLMCAGLAFGVRQKLSSYPAPATSRKGRER